MTSLLFYYQTQRADIIAARAEDTAGTQFVDGRGQAFADQFGATACFTRGFAPHFVGITFVPEKDQKPKDPELWTKRTPTEMLQRPRKSVSKTLEKRLQWLQKEWDEAWPAEIATVRDSKVLQVLDVPAERILAENLTLSCFQRTVGGVTTTYFITNFAINGLDEIKASEMMVASHIPEGGPL